MNEDNPYAPPISDLTKIEEVVGKVRLADRFTRFAAALSTV